MEKNLWYTIKHRPITNQIKLLTNGLFASISITKCIMSGFQPKKKLQCMLETRNNIIWRDKIKSETDSDMTQMELSVREFEITMIMMRALVEKAENMQE